MLWSNFTHSSQKLHGGEIYLKFMIKIHTPWILASTAPTVLLLTPKPIPPEAPKDPIHPLRLIRLLCSQTHFQPSYLQMWSCFLHFKCLLLLTTLSFKVQFSPSSKAVSFFPVIFNVIWYELFISHCLIIQLSSLLELRTWSEISYLDFSIISTQQLRYKVDTQYATANEYINFHKTNKLIW